MCLDIKSELLNKRKTTFTEIHNIKRINKKLQLFGNVITNY